MSRITPQLDKLEDLLGTISGLAGIIQDDLCRKDSEGETPTLSNHHIGCLLSANDDRANLASAERVGNIRILDNAVLAMDALVDALDGDGRELPRSTREGLYAALRLVSESLSERAAFLRENQEALGFGGEHGDE